MVKFVTQHLNSSIWRRLRLALILGVLAWIAAAPQAFLNLWLTPDQQGRLWFRLGNYERASRSFENPRWKGFSLYAGQDFATAESYFSQYQDAESLLARANALAHQQNYLQAKRGYEELKSRYPDHPASAVNIPVIQALIEAEKKMSDSQGKESDDRGGKPGTGSSAGKEGQGAMELEQYSAEQLLQDPGLTEMWLRQIQRDPSEFLITKFYLQLEKEEEDAP